MNDSFSIIRGLHPCESGYGVAAVTCVNREHIVWPHAPLQGGGVVNQVPTVSRTPKTLVSGVSPSLQTTYTSRYYRKRHALHTANVPLSERHRSTDPTYSAVASTLR
jgi:hypothetical protein